jgi:hypothetical protein
MAEQDPIEAIALIRKEWSRVLRDSDFRAGCPIVAATLEGEREPTVRDAAAEVFRSWETGLADAFAARGVAPPRARSLATLLVASIEGAIVLARAQGSTRPLERVAGELQDVVELALAGASD